MFIDNFEFSTSQRLIFVRNMPMASIGRLNQDNKKKE